ncbi:MAG: phosphopantetheine-binding protein [Planctomycetota bacterium]|jgi:acyl carrier protein
MPETEQLIADLKRHIVDTLEFEDLPPEEIGSDAPLFRDGLGLDSIDAVELVVMVEKQYGIKMRKMAETRAAFASVRTLAEFIENHEKPA